MKKLFVFVLLLLPTLFYAQQIDYNQEDGFVAKGYDVVAYFEGEAKKGKKAFTLTFDQAKLKFSSAENLEKFQAASQQYMPQFGGWCAYAMAKNGQKVSINPKTYEIRDGRLYLFYNAYFNNTLKKWKSEDTEILEEKAIEHWKTYKYKK